MKNFISLFVLLEFNKCVLSCIIRILHVFKKLHAKVEVLCVLYLIYTLLISSHFSSHI